MVSWEPSQLINKKWFLSAVVGGMVSWEVSQVTNGSANSIMDVAWGFVRWLSWLGTMYKHFEDDLLFGTPCWGWPYFWDTLWFSFCFLASWSGVGVGNGVLLEAGAVELYSLVCEEAIGGTWEFEDVLWLYLGWRSWFGLAEVRAPSSSVFRSFLPFSEDLLNSLRFATGKRRDSLFSFLWCEELWRLASARRSLCIIIPRAGNGSVLCIFIGKLGKQ